MNSWEEWELPEAADAGPMSSEEAGGEGSAGEQKRRRPSDDGAEGSSRGEVYGMGSERGKKREGNLRGGALNVGESCGSISSFFLAFSERKHFRSFFGKKKRNPPRAGFWRSGKLEQQGASEKIMGKAK